jgi:hypothetical protein
MRDEESSVLSCEGDVISTVPDMIAGVCCDCRRANTLVCKKLWWLWWGCARHRPTIPLGRRDSTVQATGTQLRGKPKLPEHHHDTDYIHASKQRLR